MKLKKGDIVMKNKLFVFVVFSVIVVFVVGAAYQSANRPLSFATMRAVSDSNDAGPAATGATWSLFNSGSVTVGNETNGAGILLVRFLGDGTAGQTMNWALYGASEPNEPFLCAAYGTATLGITTSGNAAAAGQYYCQIVTVTAYNWPIEPESSIGIQYNMGTGLVSTAGIGQLAIDTLGWKRWKMVTQRVTTSTSGAEFVNVPVFKN